MSQITQAALDWFIAQANVVLTSSAVVGAAAVVWRQAKIIAKKKIEAWVKLYETDPKQDGRPQDPFTQAVGPPAAQAPPLLPPQATAPAPLPPPPPAAIAAMARAEESAELPRDLAMMQREVELLSLKQELSKTQEAFARLRGVLDQALLNQATHKATQDQLSDAQEDLRRLRASYDAATFTHGEALAELAAQREHNRRLVAEMARLRREGEAVHEAPPYVPEAVRGGRRRDAPDEREERPSRELRTSYRNEGVGREDDTGRHELPPRRGPPPRR